MLFLYSLNKKVFKGAQTLGTLCVVCIFAFAGGGSKRTQEIQVGKLRSFCYTNMDRALFKWIEMRENKFCNG